MFNSAAVSRCRRMVVNPSTMAAADQASAAGTPSRDANSPQIALPSAMPPCKTSKYMESARARIHEGHMV